MAHETYNRTYLSVFLKYLLRKCVNNNWKQNLNKKQYIYQNNSKYKRCINDFKLLWNF